MVAPERRGRVIEILDRFKIPPEEREADPAGLGALRCRRATVVDVRCLFAHHIPTEHQPNT